ncbi:MAG TPA: hypothetical protein EYO61_06010 [Campylobacterales bacterium]|nr:hypothetical protein [Campylobacterales bacterium]
MANFKTHIVVGSVSSGVFADMLLSTHNISSNEAMGLFILGSLGSLMPDIDHPTSIPYKTTISILSILFPFGVIFSRPEYSISEKAILWVVAFFAIRFLFEQIFSKWSSHRGIFHSIPMGILLGMVGVLILKSIFWIDSYLAIWGGFFISFGFFIHLILDEVYSVDLANRRIKKSFGTALSLYKRENLLGTFAVYGAILILFPYIGDYSIVTDVIFSSEFYNSIFQNLLPSGNWFSGII